MLLAMAECLSFQWYFGGFNHIYILIFIYPRAVVWELATFNYSPRLISKRIENSGDQNPDIPMKGLACELMAGLW